MSDVGKLVQLDGPPPLNGVEDAAAAGTAVGQKLTGGLADEQRVEKLWTDRPTRLRFKGVENFDEIFASLDEYPLLLTVEEAATVLRVSRTKAYQMARDYETTGGLDGLPVVRLGGCLRVPRWALIELACFGRLVSLSELRANGLRAGSSPMSREARPAVRRIVSRPGKTSVRRRRSQGSAVSRIPRSRRAKPRVAVEQLSLLSASE